MCLTNLLLPSRQTAKRNSQIAAQTNNKHATVGKNAPPFADNIQQFAEHLINTILTEYGDYKNHGVSPP